MICVELLETFHPVGTAAAFALSHPFRFYNQHERKVWGIKPSCDLPYKFFLHSYRYRRVNHVRFAPLIFQSVRFRGIHILFCWYGVSRCCIRPYPASLGGRVWPRFNNWAFAGFDWKECRWFSWCSMYGKSFSRYPGRGNLIMFTLLYPAFARLLSPIFLFV